MTRVARSGAGRRYAGRHEARARDMREVGAPAMGPRLFCGHPWTLLARRVFLKVVDTGGARHAP